MRNPIETSLPYFRFTREMLECAVHNNLSATTLYTYALLELNKDVDEARTHKLRIAYFSDVLDVTETTIYRSIAKLKEVGLFVPTDWGYIIGNLPFAKLANTTAKDANLDKQRREFFEEIRERVLKAMDNTAVTLDDSHKVRMYIRHAYNEVYAERKESKGFFVDASGRDLYDQLDLYAPLA